MKKITVNNLKEISPCERNLSNERKDNPYFGIVDISIKHKEKKL